MWKQIFSLAGSAVSPMSKLLNGLKLLAVLIVIAIIGYAVYQTYDAFASRRASDVVINAQKQEIVKKDIVITEQTKQAENLDVGKKAEDVLIVELVTVQKKINKKTAEVIKKVDQKVEVIQKSPELTAVQKSDQAAQVNIDAIWSQYCEAAAGAEGCSDSPSTSSTTHLTLDSPFETTS